MEVILKEDVADLGFRGEVVKVADGYARNFLLPRKMAMQATAANKAIIDQMKAAAAKRSASEKAQSPRRCPHSSSLLCSALRASPAKGAICSAQSLRQTLRRSWQRKVTRLIAARFSWAIRSRALANSR